MSFDISAHLAMLRTGSASAPLFTQAGCANSAPVSEAPAVMEPHASPNPLWRQFVSALMEERVCCATSVSDA